MSLRILGLLFCISLRADLPPSVFHGVCGEPVENISNMTKNAYYFLPYNPVILEVGGYQGAITSVLSHRYPKGRVIVFEPNPRAFEELLRATKEQSNVSAYPLALSGYNGVALLHLNWGVYGEDPNLENGSSLLDNRPDLPLFLGPSIKVPCAVLDDWCVAHNITHIDFLQLDCEGLELEILQSSPEILKTVLVICTKTHFFPFRVGTAQYFELEAFLKQSGFTLFSHWYREGIRGEATFVRKYLYDSIYE